MDTYPRLRKKLVVGIILLLIGAAVTPNFGIIPVHASSGDDGVEISIQACGIQGFGNTTVKLTRVQYQNLKQYLVEFRQRLNQTTTAEEIVTIFKHTVVDLDEYGLLPKEMNVEQAQQLVTAGYQNIFTILPPTTRLPRYQISNTSNFLCLIAGQTKETRLHGYFETGCSLLSYLLFGLYLFAQMIDKDPIILMNVIFFIEVVRTLYHMINSIRIVGTGNIAFGNVHDTGGSIPPFYQYEPAMGWITTLGLLGKKSWDGSFYGRLLLLPTFDADETIYFIGALGFLGLKLRLGNDELFFLGSAIGVKVN